MRPTVDGTSGIRIAAKPSKSPLKAEGILRQISVGLGGDMMVELPVYNVII